MRAAPLRGHASAGSGRCGSGSGHGASYLLGRGRGGASAVFAVISYLQEL